MWDRLTDEERAWKEGARRFAEASIRPHYREADRANVLPVATHTAAYDDGGKSVFIADSDLRLHPNSSLESDLSHCLVLSLRSSAR